MSRFLLVDIGAGTMDILYYDNKKDLHYKAVVESPVRLIAKQASSTKGNLLIQGCEMGGGPISEVIKRRAETHEVVMTANAAMTIHHDLARVKSFGIKIIEESDIEGFKQDKSFTALTLGDLEISRIEQIVKSFGVPFEFDAAAFCVQDHGMAPKGMSHLDYRHNFFRARLDKNPYPEALLYKSDEVPKTMNRLRAVAKSAKLLPVDEIFLMDSGMAAILGASLDSSARGEKKILVLDVATSHTVGAAIEDGELAGFFEYHTCDIDLKRLEGLLKDLSNKNIIHEDILSQGGHGAYIRKAVGFDNIKVIIATGPKRQLVERSRLPIVFGAPLGDNMMTGTAGLLEALFRYSGIKIV